MSSNLLDFHLPDDADRAWIKAAAYAGGARSAEYAFANIVTWADVYGETVATVNGRVTICEGSDGGCYSWGVGGDGDLTAFVRTLARDAAARGNPLAFWGLDHADRTWLEAHYPGCFDFTPHEESWDYCYLLGNLAELPGGKFQKKRNHIRAFEAAFPDWRTEPLSRNNADACLAVAAAWDEEDAADGTRDRNSENGERALRHALSRAEDWKLDGLLLLAGSKPVAFSLGERLSSGFYDVLFEKAPRTLRGAYPMINREFARFIARRYPEIQYLNREESMGEPHLKKAKDSYHPDLMVANQYARLKEGVAL